MINLDKYFLDGTSREEIDMPIYIKQYKEYIERGEFSQASKLLAENPNFEKLLSKCDYARIMSDKIRAAILSMD